MCVTACDRGNTLPVAKDGSPADARVNLREGFRIDDGSQGFVSPPRYCYAVLRDDGTVNVHEYLLDDSRGTGVDILLDTFGWFRLERVAEPTHDRTPLAPTPSMSILERDTPEGTIRIYLWESGEIQLVQADGTMSRSRTANSKLYDILKMLRHEPQKPSSLGVAD
jgi:hypothetical protein